ncbi:MAG: MerR family transcriptional regulator [Rhodospirillaceae bacterium]
MSHTYDQPLRSVSSLDCGAAGVAVPVILIENETGLTKEVIRKWESRYGFPRPERDENGDRIYPPDQVVRLRLIRRLLGAGMRPGKVVGLELETLERLTEQMSLEPPGTTSDGFQQVLDALSGHDLPRLTHLLKGQLIRQGLSVFVRETVARLNVLIGECWLRGEINIFEEHLYTEAVCDLLHESIRTVINFSGSPRVLLTTAPGELHTIGLLMASTILSLEGAHCISLGAQMPAVEIVTAAKGCAIDVVGLSFSIARPARDAALFLRDLRARLDPAVEIWAGGVGVSRLRRMDGVRYMPDLEKVSPTITAWRKSRAGAAS